MIRSWYDAVHDWAITAGVRHKAKINLKKVNGDPAQGEAHGLFLYHQDSDAIERHFQRLVSETEGLIIWHRLFNPDGGGAPKTDVIYRHPALSMPSRYGEMNRNRGIQGGLADVAILPSVIATDAPFVWVMEYDVDFAGHWGAFFEAFADNRADYLGSMIASYYQSKTWSHWRKHSAPNHIHPFRRFRAFNPLIRLSRRFAISYMDTLEEPGWHGHYEFTLPTIAVNNGFAVEEIGGHWPFCPSSRRGKYYTAPDTQDLKGKASFVWRPIFPALYVDQPDIFPQAGLLYHPCKIEVQDWTKVRLLRKAQFTIGASELSAAVVMCTYNGARHLEEQLESLLKQSRLPDALFIGDDASSDDTLAIIRKFAQNAPFLVKVIERPKRIGFAANFKSTTNAALESKVKYDLLFFCDQDDVWDEQKIELVCNAAQSTNALAYSHDLTIFFDGERAGKSMIPSYFEHLRTLGLSPHLCCKGCALTVRTDLIRELGWPENEKMSHDAWLAMITTGLGRRETISAPLIKHRIYGKNASSWIISPEEAQKRASAPLDKPFESMLDFYGHHWSSEQIEMLRACLKTIGSHITNANQ